MRVVRAIIDATRKVQLDDDNGINLSTAKDISESNRANFANFVIGTINFSHDATIEAIYLDGRLRVT